MNKEVIYCRTRMATSLNVNEIVEHTQEDFADLLTCTICLETFKQPKYLPCLHTFCETCINTYIVSTVKGEKSEGFKCPVCRRLVPFGESTRNPETWAKTLPGNHFVVSMVDMKAMKKAEKLCDACSSKSISKKAIAWCSVCEEAYCDTCEANHRTYKMARNHKIVPIKDINEDTPISNICASVACDEHPDKLIEIYCKDHSQPCCTICATVHHRKCEQVITIDKAVSGVKDSTKAQKLTKKLKETSQKLVEIIQNRNQNTTNFENEIDGILVEIANARKTLNEKLDQLENKIREEVISARKVNVLRLSEESAELLALKSTCDHWKNMFEACVYQGSEIQCLVKMEEIYKKIPQLENDLSKVVLGIQDISIKFEATDIISNTVRFGSLHSSEQRKMCYAKKYTSYQSDGNESDTATDIFVPAQPYEKRISPLSPIESPDHKGRSKYHRRSYSQRRDSLGSSIEDVEDSYSKQRLQNRSKSADGRELLRRKEPMGSSGRSPTPNRTDRFGLTTGDPGFRSITPNVLPIQQYNRSLDRRSLTNITSGLRPFAPRTPDDINIEDVVKFSRQGGKLSQGKIKFVGHLQDRRDIYLGVELDKEDGTHDGTFEGVRYYKCKPNKGVFVAFNYVVMAWASNL